MNSDSPLYLTDQNSDSADGDLLSIALIGPDEESRGAAADAISGCQGGEIREYSSYPVSPDELPLLLEQHYDVIVIDLDSDPERALKMVESTCASGAATVMVYSVKADSQLLVRCMRAGAREFLTQPFVESAVSEALDRASARRSASRPPKKAGGRLLAFLGAKGGDGVTTLACNFAVSLAQESGQNTLLIDLDLPLGDAALNLGVVAEYSTINALQNAGRLDSSFLSKLLVKHSSGVSVLAAPGKFPQFDAPNESIDKLLTVARQDFDNIVIDMGSRLDLMGAGLFKDGSTVYLVIQAGIAGLRNANRLIAQYFNSEPPKLEIVLNRYQARALGVAEDQITKALPRPAQWKIPNDYAAVRRMQHTAIPLALEDSPISRLIRQMARSACGLPPTPGKGSGFSFKKISRSISAKISSPEEPQALTQLELTSEWDHVGVPPVASRPEAPAKTQAKPPYTSPAETIPEKETQPLLTAGDTVDLAETKQETSQSADALELQNEPETRNFQGATYVKDTDVRWHRQQTQADSIDRETPAITWSTPAPIAYGTALNAAQLNASAPVPGKLIYTPPAGEVLAAGEHTLSVTFTPADKTLYRTAGAAISLVVTKATPMVMWPAPAGISYGTALGAAQLNATALVPGTLIYTPPLGEVLPAGTHTLLVTFMPKDLLDYATVQTTVPLAVTRAMPAIPWPPADPISFGSARSAREPDVESEVVPAKATPLPAAKPVPHSKSAPVRVPPAKTPVKIAAKAQAKAPAKAPAKVAAKHRPEAPAQPPAETPANALVKLGAPNGPIDVGPGLNLMGSAVFEDGTTIYLVMQPGSAGLPNSNRLVSQFFSAQGPKPDFVVNRFESHSPDPAEDQTSTALTRPAYAPIFRLIGRMVRPALAAPATPEKKTGFSIRNFGRSIWAKISTQEMAPSVTQLGLAADQQEDSSTRHRAAPRESSGRVGDEPVYARRTGTLYPMDEKPVFPMGDLSDRSGTSGRQQERMHSASAPSRQGELETRVYMGAIYEKGEDGQWHLQQTAADEMKQQQQADAQPASVETARAQTRKPRRKAKPAAKKPPAKASAKRPVKAAAKPMAKAPASRPVKAVTKPAAKIPARKSAPPAKRPVVASIPKTAQRVKAYKSLVDLPAPEPEAQQPAREPELSESAPELVT